MTDEELTEEAYIKAMTDVWKNSPDPWPDQFPTEDRAGNPYYVKADGTILKCVIDTFNSGFNKGQP